MLKIDRNPWADMLMTDMRRGDEIRAFWDWMLRADIVTKIGQGITIMSTPSGTSEIFRRYQDHRDADQLLVIWPRLPGRATLRKQLADADPQVIFEKARQQGWSRTHAQWIDQLTLDAYLQDSGLCFGAVAWPQPADLGVVQLASGFTLYEHRDWIAPTKQRQGAMLQDWGRNGIRSLHGADLHVSGTFNKGHLAHDPDLLMWDLLAPTHAFRFPARLTPGSLKPCAHAVRTAWSPT